MNPADIDIWNQHLLEEHDTHPYVNLKGETPLTSDLKDDVDLPDYTN